MSIVIKDKLYSVLAVVSIIAIVAGIAWLIMEQDISESTNEENRLFPDMVSGYEYGKYEKFNSPASENGLGDTKIYIYGECTEIVSRQGSVACFVENGDEEWLVSLWNVDMVGEKDFSFLVHKEIYIFGMYTGYSNVVQKPAIQYDTILCEGETYSFDALINEASKNSTQVLVKPTTEPIKTVEDKENFNEETVISQLEVTPYQYTSSIKTPWVFLTVKNNTKFNLDITIDLKTYDSDGNIIGAKSYSQEAFENNTETIFSFMLDEEPSSIEYEISAKEEDWYECVVANLVYESTSAKNKEIISVTNNGDDAAEFVECTVLFFNGEKVVGFDTRYFSDDDYELKPGKTITEELTSYKAYDSYKIYFTGHR